MLFAHLYAVCLFCLLNRRAGWTQVPPVPSQCAAVSLNQVGPLCRVKLFDCSCFLPFLLSIQFHYQTLPLSERWEWPDTVAPVVSICLSHFQWVWPHWRENLVDCRHGCLDLTTQHELCWHLCSSVAHESQEWVSLPEDLFCHLNCSLGLTIGLRIVRAGSKTLHAREKL